LFFAAGDKGFSGLLAVAGVVEWKAADESFVAESSSDRSPRFDIGNSNNVKFRARNRIAVGKSQRWESEEQSCCAASSQTRQDRVLDWLTDRRVEAAGVQVQRYLRSYVLKKVETKYPAGLTCLSCMSCAVRWLWY